MIFTNNKNNSEAQEKLNALNAVQAVIEFESDGTILNANENFLNALGYGLNEIVGKHHSMFVEKEYANSQEYKEFWRSLASGNLDSRRFKRITRTGEEIWIQASYNPLKDNSGRVFKVIKFAIDITELVRTEQAAKRMADESTKFKYMLDSMPLNVLLADLDGRIISANPASINAFKKFEKLLGVKADDVLGKTYGLFFDASSNAKMPTINSSTLPFQGLIQIGDERFDILINAIYDASGNYSGSMLTWSVVTEEIRAKENEQRVKRELEDTIKILKGSSTGLESSTADLSQSVARISESSNDVQNYVNSVSVATEEMISSISEISKNTDKAAKMTEDAVVQMNSTENIIKNLQVSSNEIASILEVVTEIANQTNLLALNATIEAARAGEAGKGFAVVASEVKELANRTAEATGDISKKISAIQGESSSAINSISVASTSVRTINEVAITIAGAVEEQTAVTSEIGKSMRNATEKVSEMSSEMNLVTDLVKGNIERTDEIKTVTGTLVSLVE
jgi:methyl-accepting chemotaxis protein